MIETVLMEILINASLWAGGLMTGLGLGTALASQRFDKERTEWMDA